MTKLIDLQSNPLPPNISPKVSNLQWLIQRKLAVPHTQVVVDYDPEEDGDRAELRQLLQQHLDLERPYAIRSAANLEDEQQFSMAGQLATVLDVRGLEPLLSACDAVLAAAQSPVLQSYLAETGLADGELRLAIIVQEMVRPVYSGVVFSQNPTTGAHEIVIEAVEGSGEALLQEGVTPFRWIHRLGGWTAQPNESPLALALLQEIVESVQGSAAARKQAVDMEWVYDGTELFWVQLRPITGLEKVNFYSSRIAREVMPGIIKPLIWSVNVPVVNRAWVDIFTELIGPNDLDPDSLARAFYFRAYFNMGAIGQVFTSLGFPPETLEIMRGTESDARRPSFKFRPGAGALRRIPRLARFVISKLNYEKRLKAILPELETSYRRLASIDPGSLSDAEIMTRIDRLTAVTYEAAHVNILTPMLMQAYDGLLRSRLRKLGLDATLLETTADLGNLDDYVPGPSIAALHRQFQQLEPSLQAAVQSASYEEVGREANLRTFMAEVERFLERFGHFSDSGNDFSAVSWRENPTLVLRMIAQTPPADRATGSWEALPLSGMQRRLLGPLHRRARRFRYYREVVSYIYTYGYGLYRQTFLTLADRFVNRGLLHQRDDIFFLYADEVRALVEAGQLAESQTETVKERRQALQDASGIILPDIIYGEEPPPTTSLIDGLETLVGVPTSRGYYTGPVKVITSLDQLEQLQEGDVLVVPHSDVSWTPLFARAGAVVAESGGILSHSSIIAREYGLPAVVSVNRACQLPDGVMVTVDGYKGEVIRNEGQQP